MRICVRTNFPLNYRVTFPTIIETTSAKKLAGPMPESLKVTLANLIYFEKAQLPQALTNRVIRLAAFHNPEFYKSQAMRLSVWDKPRVIGCAESYPQHIALPRGCLDAALSLLRENGIACDLQDERFGGQLLGVSFVGDLRLDQEAAIAGMLQHDAGVLCAPTAFGKTVTAAAMIARQDDNARYRALLQALRADEWAGEIAAHGGLKPLDHGLYGCSEMFVNGLLALAEAGLPGQRLEVEITERMLMDDLEAVRGTLDALRAMGVEVAESADAIEIAGGALHGADIDSLQVPNVFTPNGDGINDAFQLRGTEASALAQINLVVYSRWGQEVFRTNDPQFAWDGRYQGRALSPGVYLYHLSWQSKCGTRGDQQGAVTLNR